MIEYDLEIMINTASTELLRRCVKPRKAEMRLVPVPEGYKFSNQLYHKSNSPYCSQAK